jgi:hypothetical protein
VFLPIWKRILLLLKQHLLFDISLKGIVRVLIEKKREGIVRVLYHGKAFGMPELPPRVLYLI